MAKAEPREQDAAVVPPQTARKRAMIDLADRSAPERARRIEANRFYYEDHYRFMRFLVPEKATVIDLGCGIGDLLGALSPKHGVGVDISEPMLDEARARHPAYTFHHGDVEDPAFLATLGGPFDVIVLSDTVGFLEDIEATLAALHVLCGPDTRVIVSYYARLWQPLLRLGEAVGAKQRQLPLNWLSTNDIVSLLELADFEMIKREWRQLVPKRLFGLGTLVNRTLGTLPVLRRLSLRNYAVARPLRAIAEVTDRPSVTVLIPCRNERGNIEPPVD